MGKETLLINQSTIKELVTVKEMIEIVDRTYKGLTEGTVKNPSKVNLDLGDNDDFPNYDGFFNAMPSYIGWQDVAGMKWVGGFAGAREEAGLPYIVGLIILADPRMGEYLAVTDGQYITNIRTGVQTATALSYIVKKPSLTLSIFGSGAQARTNVRAISEIYEIEKLTISNHRRVTAETFAEDVKHLVKGDITIVDDPKNACDSDVLITATHAKEPFIKSEWIKPGTIIFPLASHQEVDDELILRADKIVVDHPVQALHRGALEHIYAQGDISQDDIYATFGELTTGRKKIGDISNEIVICIPIGMGALDVAIANLAYERAKERGLGESFDFLA